MNISQTFSGIKWQETQLFLLIILAPMILWYCSVSSKTDTMKIAVITKTAVFRHDNISVAAEALFLKHVKGAILWTAGKE